MKTYPIELSNGHILLDIDNGPVLVDTGSPISFNRNAHMELNGVGYSMPKSVANVDADYITSHVGRDTAGMVGTGILGSYDFTIDTRAGEMTFEAPKEGFLPLESRFLLRCILVRMTVDGKNAVMVLDTGAPVAYISRAFSDGHPVVGYTEDFSPLSDGDAFTTPLRELTTEAAGKRFPVRYGELPSELATMLSILGADGVIGMDFLSRFAVNIDHGKVSVKAFE